MKTIRTNCFETNSSSTHSITINTNSSVTAEDKYSFEVNGVLYPGRVNDEAARKDFYVAKYGDWVFTADTKSSKAVLIIHYIYSILDSEGTAEPEQVNQVMADLAAYMGYDRIELGDEYWNHYSISRYSEEVRCDEIEKMLEYIGFSVSGNKVLIDMQGLGLYVQALVNDPCKTIVDCSEEH